MLEAAQRRQVASDTISSILRYMSDNLPELVISAIAGAAVGSHECTKKDHSEAGSQKSGETHPDRKLTN